MLCCLLIALAGGPVVFWAGPRVGKLSGKDCCADNRRAVWLVSAGGAVALCSAMILLGWFQPAPFRHICSLLVTR